MSDDSEDSWASFLLGTTFGILLLAIMLPEGCNCRFDNRPKIGETVPPSEPPSEVRADIEAQREIEGEGPWLVARDDTVESAIEGYLCTFQGPSGNQLGWTSAKESAFQFTRERDAKAFAELLSETRMIQTGWRTVKKGETR